MKTTVISLAAACFAAAAAPAGAMSIADDYSSFWVFGDSLSDPGNLFAATAGTVPPSPPYFNGRFSNGPVWAERISDEFAARGKATGNFAFGGGKAVGAVDSPFDIPDLPDQLALFGLTVAGGAPLGADPLAALWFGGNDLFEALSGGPGALIATAESAADAVADGAGFLFSTYGIDDFVVLNLPDIGESPAYAGGPAQGLMSIATQTFNARLAGNLAALRSSGADVRLVDAFGLGLETRADPGAFGFVNTTDPCFDGLTVCADPDGYLFFDDVHPTQAVHALLAQSVRAAVAPVPLPGAGLLLAFGVAGLAGVGAIRDRSRPKAA